MADALPGSVGKPVLGPQSSILGELMIISLTSDNTSLLDLRTLADWTIRPRLLSTGGVAQVSVIGGDLKEYQIMLRLNHPGIVRVAAMEDTVHTGPVILMELVEGETLGEFAGRATRRERSAAAVRLLQAAAYMHSKGVCHLDLKPENVMVSGHGDGPVVKIIDFGMADCAGEAMFKSVGGNRRYGAPEQFEAGYRCDPRADVWSLGKMMAWMRPGWSLRVAARRR